jgi:hypothetical protein
MLIPFGTPPIAVRWGRSPCTTRRYVSVHLLKNRSCSAHVQSSLGFGGEVWDLGFVRHSSFCIRTWRRSRLPKPATQNQSRSCAGLTRCSERGRSRTRGWSRCIRSPVPGFVGLAECHWLHQRLVLMRPSGYSSTSGGRVIRPQDREMLRPRLKPRVSCSPESTALVRRFGRRRRTTGQALGAQILIQVWPVNPVTCTGDLPMGPPQCDRGAHRVPREDSLKSVSKVVRATVYPLAL